jgi:hypothetical protein
MKANPVRKGAGVIVLPYTKAEHRSWLVTAERAQFFRAADVFSVSTLTVLTQIKC